MPSARTRRTTKGCTRAYPRQGGAMSALCLRAGTRDIENVGPVVSAFDATAIRCDGHAEEVAGAVPDQCSGGDLGACRRDLDGVSIVAVEHDEVTVGARVIPRGAFSAPPVDMTLEP